MKKVKATSVLGIIKLLFYLDFYEINHKRKKVFAMIKWRCSVCGYIHEGEPPPAECPICHAPKEAFKPI